MALTAVRGDATNSRAGKKMQAGRWVEAGRVRVQFARYDPPSRCFFGN